MRRHDPLISWDLQIFSRPKPLFRGFQPREKRINRKLKPDLQALKATRGARAQLDLGYFYVIDYQRNFVIDHHINLEAYGRELGTLVESEKLVYDE